MRTPRVGDEARVEFMDHTVNGDHLHRCTVWGRITAVNDEHIVLRWWDVAGKGGEDVDNIEQTCILRSAIRKYTKLS